MSTNSNTSSEEQKPQPEGAGDKEARSDRLGSFAEFLKAVGVLVGKLDDKE